MKKDIPIKKVEDVIIAIIPEDDNVDSEMWQVYIVNTKDQPLRDVLIASIGYGEIEGESLRTSTLRYFFDELPANEAVLVEPIMRKLFTLANEYWISFSLEGYMYDKKYIFVPGSLEPDFFSHIPLLDRAGVMIK
jgi:hypothetical protein